MEELSYSACCYIENNDGDYTIKCDMQTEDKDIHSEYQGKNIVEGLNSLLDDLSAKMAAEPEPEPENVTDPEDEVKRLSGVVERLYQEKIQLQNEIIDLKKANQIQNQRQQDADRYEQAINNFLDFLVLK